jgi:lisH domain-containing protein FOPNL
VDELRAGLTDMMEQSGSLGRLRARVRAEVFSSLEARDPVHPPLSSANFLINELIRDYFRFNGYR